MCHYAVRMKYLLCKDRRCRNRKKERKVHLGLGGKLSEKCNEQPIILEKSCEGKEKHATGQEGGMNEKT